MRVLGLDGCKRGWVVVLADDSGILEIFIARDAAAALERASRSQSIDAMVIDIPIGLADTVPRTADRLAAQVIGERRSSVFEVPVRRAIEAPTRLEADAVSRAANERGVGSMSYALRDKILEVDAFARQHLCLVREGHPEVSFRFMNGAPLLHYKKTLAGALERREILDRAGLLPPVDAEITLERKAAFDDVHDAAAMAWTALRVARGETVSIPAEPEVFSDGLPSAIWY